MKMTTSTISNSINHSPLRFAFIIMPFVLMCVATLPGARAVFPAPDGGYPNGNTAGALFNNTAGSNNIALGVEAGVNIADASHVICSGTAGANLNSSCFIGNIFGTTSGGGTSVFINSDGQLGTMTSSGRFRERIKPMEQASDALFALKPVTFRYKREIDSQQIPQFGLVAEDVEKVNPDLVVRDKEGKPYSARYEQ